MSNKVFKTVLIGFVVFFSALFLGNADVKAGGDDTGYAKCTYDFTEDRYNIKPYRYYRINIAFYKTGNDFSSYKSYASVKCSKSNEASSFMYDDLCSIDNYNDIFHNASKYQALYKKGVTDVQNHVNPTWNCPSQIYLNRDKYNDQMSVYMSEKDCNNKNLIGSCSTIAKLKQKDIKQKGNLDGTEKPGETPGGDNLWLDDTTGELTTERPANSDSTDIGGILNWGNSDVTPGYAGDADNPCSFLSTETRDWISAFMSIISIIGIILLIVMSAAEFIKVITGSKEDGIKEAFKHTIIRVVCIIILLLLPMLVTWILNIANDNAVQLDEHGKPIIGADGDPLCKITK